MKVKDMGRVITLKPESLKVAKNTAKASETQTPIVFERAKQAIQLFTSDARYAQIFTLTTLLSIANFWSGFGAGWLAAFFAQAGAISAQYLGSKWTGQRFDIRSALITGLSIAILLRAGQVAIPQLGSLPLYHFAAAFIGILSKFVITWQIGDGRRGHIFNPANFGIALLLILPIPAWIAPGQWGTESWFLAFILAAATLVLASAKRMDIALGFFGFYAALLFARALYLGDPMAIPLHKLQSGALIVFAFFMITDPKTSPASRAGRLIFAGLVASLAFYLTAFEHVREGVIYALILCCPLVPIINHFLPGEFFRWGKNKQRDPSQDINSRRPF